MKKIIVTITIVLSVFWSCFFTAYVSNRIDIKQYNSGSYKRNIFAVFGFMQPYVDDYNMGNKYYMQNDYERAIGYYQRALRKNPPHSHYNDDRYNKECSIRINMVLAMLAQLDTDNISKEDVDEALQIINDSKDILSENGCARSADEGHSNQAVELYKQLCQLESSLTQNEMDDTENRDDTPKQNDTEETDESQSQNKEKIDELMRNQSEGTSERNDTIDEMRRMQENDDSGDGYYDGKRW